MNIDIINQLRTVDVYGYSGVAQNRDYAATGLKLMDKMWQTVNAKNLKNKGINFWVYEPGEKMFAGVELTDVPGETELEHKVVTLTKYGWYKHIGPYHLLKYAGPKMSDELRAMGFEPTLPYIEIYGHWTSDENKLETELLMSLK